MTVRTGCFVFATVMLAASAACSSDTKRTQAEFGFEAWFPADKPLCDAVSGEHHVGWFTPLSGDCERFERRVIVLASYNAAFQTSPQAAAYCSDREVDAAAQAGLRLSFPGRSSATCLKRREDGSVLLTVAAQAWEWPDPKPDDPPEFRTPWINYYAYLETSPAALDEDAKVFKAVLDRVRIMEPER